MNCIYLVGRVLKKDNIKNYAGGLCKLKFDLQVEDNIIPVVFDSVLEYIETIDQLVYKNSLIGIKGSLATNKTKLYVKGEKITDLNNFKEEDKNDIN